TAAEYRRTCVHELVAEQAARTPQQWALVCGQERLTYGELNRRANQVAQYLKQRGVGPDVLVGIAVERSLEMVVGVLGILKAGGAYVPLDPGYPPERLSFMLEDSGMRILLTQERLLKSLPRKAEIEVVCLDREWAAIEQ